jgi:hypothetical protein
VNHDDLRAWVAKLLRQELFYFVVDTGVSAVEHWTHHTSRLVSRLEVITKGTSINELVQWRLVRGLCDVVDVGQLNVGVFEIYGDLVVLTSTVASS